MMAERRTAPWPTVDQLIDYAMDQADDAARCDYLVEPSFLGGVICGPDGPIHRLWFMLGPGHFFDPVHAAIWATCLRLRHVEVATAGKDALVNEWCVHREMAKVPSGQERVAEICRIYLPCESSEIFLLRAIRKILECSAKRRAAARLADRSSAA